MRRDSLSPTVINICNGFDSIGATNEVTMSGTGNADFPLFNDYKQEDSMSNQLSAIMQVEYRRMNNGILIDRKQYGKVEVEIIMQNIIYGIILNHGDWLQNNLNILVTLIMDILMGKY